MPLIPGRSRRPRRRRSPLGTLVVLGALVYALMRGGVLDDLLPSGDGVSAAQQARVVQVHDGDTLTVEGPDGRTRVRLFGVDTPERGQPFSNRARRFLTRRAEGKAVRLEPIETDRLGRLVARVQVAEEDLAEALLDAGLAWHFRRYSDDRAYARAEADARAAGRGLWSDADPVPPWDWRREHMQR